VPGKIFCKTVSFDIVRRHVLFAIGFSERSLWLTVVGLFGLTTTALADSSTCREHGGIARCDPSHQVVCKDGALDKRYTCTSGKGGKSRIRVLKFKPPPNRGQILKPDESPPPETLEQSYKEMK
jgi:hypothetical protein